MSLSKTSIRILLFCFAVLAALVGFRSLAFCHPSLFSDPDHYHYKWFAIPFSALLLFHDRKRLAAELGEPAPGGLVALFVFGFIGFVGRYGQQMRFELIALFGQILALAWSCFGSRIAKRLVFPLLAFIMCLPVELFIDFGHARDHTYICLPFILHSVSAALDCCGVETLLDGMTLQIPSAGLTVNSLSPDCHVFALLQSVTLVIVIAAWRLASLPRRLFVFALAIPLAVFANAVHVFALLAARIVGAGDLVRLLSMPKLTTFFVLALVGGLAFVVTVPLAKGEKSCART